FPAGLPRSWPVRAKGRDESALSAVRWHTREHGCAFRAAHAVECGSETRRWTRLRLLPASNIQINLGHPPIRTLLDFKLMPCDCLHIQFGRMALRVARFPASNRLQLRRLEPGDVE